MKKLRRIEIRTDSKYGYVLRSKSVALPLRHLIGHQDNSSATVLKARMRDYWQRFAPSKPEETAEAWDMWRCQPKKIRITNTLRAYPVNSMGGSYMVSVDVIGYIPASVTPAHYVAESFNLWMAKGEKPVQTEANIREKVKEHLDSCMISQNNTTLDGTFGQSERIRQRLRGVRLESVIIVEELE